MFETTHKREQTDGIIKNNDDSALVEQHSLARRSDFAAGLTRAMTIGIGVMTILMVIVWLMDTQYTQIILFAAITGQMTICAALYPVLRQRGRVIGGFYLFSISFLIMVAAAPMLIPEVMPPAAIGYVVLVLVSSLLLGREESRLLIGLSVVAFTVNIVLVNAVSPNWFTPLDNTTIDVVAISIGLIALLIATVMLRLVVNSQEDQFWQAQLANLEIERRMIEELQQREQLERANLEIEEWATVERQQSDHLRALTIQILDTATQLTAASSELQATITQLTAGAAEQNAVVTQIAATVEQVRMTVTQTAERAQKVADTSQESIGVSHTGNQVIAETIDGMTLIGQQVEDIAETILLLSERTQQIGEIIETVNGLADQSKLLALNASIEAARAGEEGKGFAVVAMEVRQLAEQSREATARVRDILSDIQNATNTAVMVTEQGSKGAQEGMNLTERAGSVIEELTSAVETAARTSDQIAVSTRQQTTGVEQLATAMSQIKQASSQNAAAMKQAEQSVRDLQVMANQLEEVAGRYDLGENGSQA